MVALWRCNSQHCAAAMAMLQCAILWRRNDGGVAIRDGGAITCNAVMMAML